MDLKTFSLLAGQSGLELSESRLKALYDYSRRLFASLKPQPGQDFFGDEETGDQVKRIFGETRSIQELDMEQVAPAVFFGIGHLSGE